MDILQRIMFCYSRLTCLKDCWSILQCALILGMERTWIILYKYLYKYRHFLLSHSLQSISDQRGKKSCEVTDKTRCVNIFKNEFYVKKYTYIYVTVIDCTGKSFFHLWVKEWSWWLNLVLQDFQYDCSSIIDEKEEFSV